MKFLSSCIISLLTNKGIISQNDDDLEIYIYGLNLFLYTVLSTFSLIAIGFVVSKFVETIIIISLFYISQTYGGGYHANTHLSCFLTMHVCLIVYYFFLSIPFNPCLLLFVGCSSLIVLFLFPLVLHPNKRYLYKKSSYLMFRSRLLTIMQAFIFLFSFRFHFHFHSFALSLFFCAISRFIAHCIYAS